VVWDIFAVDLFEAGRGFRSAHPLPSPSGRAGASALAGAEQREPAGSGGRRQAPTLLGAISDPSSAQQRGERCVKVKVLVSEACCGWGTRGSPGGKNLAGQRGRTCLSCVCNHFFSDTGFFLS